jgi:polyisoprenyl-phosphate glycosyltransferase
MRNNLSISICIPVFYGEKTIKNLVLEVKKKLCNYRLEIVLVNDGSKDNTKNTCIDLSNKYEFVKFINLRKNFGEHNAVLCGLNYVTGDYVVIIDDDFQNPPSEIKKLIDRALEFDYDVVYSKYVEKKHHWARNLGSKFNDKVSTWLLNKPTGLYLSSFKLIKREVVQEIIKYRGPFPYIDGLILRVTDNIGVKTVSHEKRQEGQSNYNLSKLISLWLNMFVNFSIKPLRIATVTGVIISSCSFFLGAYFIIDKILHPSISAGWTSIIVLVLFTTGMQLIFLGLIGEYLGKQYLDQNGTPPFVVDEEHL